MTRPCESASDAARLADQWMSINWEAAELAIGRLQARITKAAKEGRRNKVRRLQYLLTHSFYAKAMAVRRVVTNSGGKTAGVDGVLWSTDAAKMKAVLRLTDRRYRARPLRRVLIPKKGKKGQVRPLGIPTMHDRAMQALYLLALDPVAEALADENSFGFRVGRCAQDAGEYLFSLLCHRRDDQWILEGDIKGCFDHISHARPMDNVPMDRSVLA